MNLKSFIATAVLFIILLNNNLYATDPCDPITATPDINTSLRDHFYLDGEKYYYSFAVISTQTPTEYEINSFNVKNVYEEIDFHKAMEFMIRNSIVKMTNDLIPQPTLPCTVTVNINSCWKFYYFDPDVPSDSESGYEPCLISPCCSK